MTFLNKYKMHFWGALKRGLVEFFISFTVLFSYIFKQGGSLTAPWAWRAILFWGCHFSTRFQVSPWRDNRVDGGTLCGQGLAFLLALRLSGLRVLACRLARERLSFFWCVPLWALGFCLTEAADSFRCSLFAWSSSPPGSPALSCLLHMAGLCGGWVKLSLNCPCVHPPQLRSIFWANLCLNTPTPALSCLHMADSVGIG